MINLTNPIFGKLSTISASRLNSFFSCGVRFRNEYLYELKQPGGIGACRGKALHCAIAEDNKLFMHSGQRLSVDALKQIAIEKLNGSLGEGVFISKSKEGETAKLIETARAQVKQCMEMYFECKKDWSPTSVEERVTVNVGYPLPVVAHMDMTDENNCIWDWKTTAKTPDPQEGIQNWLYSKIFEQLRGIRPTFKYFYFVLTKRTPRIVIKELSVMKNYDILDRYVDTYLNAIEKEVFLPSTIWNFLCGESTCPFWQCCEFKKI